VVGKARFGGLFSVLEMDFIVGLPGVLLEVDI